MKWIGEFVSAWLFITAGVHVGVFVGLTESDASLPVRLAVLAPALFFIGVGVLEVRGRVRG